MIKLQIFLPLLLASILTACVEDEAWSTSSGLSYLEPSATHTVGVPIKANPLKKQSNGITSYSITPSLPDGLHLDEKTGVISGVPKKASKMISHTVIGHGKSGKVSTTLEIGVIHQAMVTVNDLNSRYLQVSDRCSDGLPGYACSGVFMRAVGEKDKPWDVGSGEAERQAVSFSYIRRDIKISPRALYGEYGLVFKSIHAMDPASAYKVLCIFPYNAISDSRTQYGCGEFKPRSTIEDVSTCKSAGVFDAIAWFALPDNKKCSFGANDKTEFEQSIAAQNLIFNFYSTVIPSYNENIVIWGIWNEYILPIWNVDDRPPLPLEAFFYSAGKANSSYSDDFNSTQAKEHLRVAQQLQQSYLQETGLYVPIVRITSDRTAPFKYLESDQTSAVLEPTENR